ncbi:MAG: chloramphenicol phosphotransferase [Verrucomicrobia bacterium]|nr:MAG: chloramphenicol phosphotransferase [Verrucomicrobiota bacterium]
MDFGQIVILSGPSRAGKSSVATAIQDTLDGIWMNLGMDLHIAATPPAYRPGVGLRPQKLKHATTRPGRVPLEVLENQVPVLYAALYQSIAAHSRLGLNVVADVYHHDFYTKPLNILAQCARRLRGLPVLFVGIHCPVEVIWERRKATWGQVLGEVADDVETAVELGQRAAREHTYDLELDTSRLSAAECAAEIRKRLDAGPPGVALRGLVGS